MEQTKPVNHMPLVVLFGASFFFMLAVVVWVPVDKKQSHKEVYEKIVTLSKLKQKSHIVLPSVPLDVLGVQQVREDAPLPPFTRLEVDSRRQAYNLSCEFAAASAVLYYFTRQPKFSPQNQKQAEEILIEKMYVSQNPNIGIRMGDDAIDADSKVLYKNLNQRFGGAQYYGVHAPPFFDLFAQYGLQAKPIRFLNTVKSDLQRALSSGHLVIAWIRVGYGENVDIALSYGGSVPVVKGEHSIVVTGYDKNGVFVMDPANGAKKHITYETLFAAAKPFPLPFLDVYPSATKEENKGASIPIDSITGLDRSGLSLRIENASDRIGAGNEISEILRDFGYHIASLQKVKQQEDGRGIIVRVTNAKKDFIPLLQRDLDLAGVFVSEIAVDTLSPGIDVAVLIL